IQSPLSFDPFGTSASLPRRKSLGVCGLKTDFAAPSAESESTRSVYGGDAAVASGAAAVTNRAHASSRARRALTTIVPAAMSPNLWRFFDTHTTIAPTRQ